LYPGKYTLHAAARNYRGEISKEAVYAFRVRPPWHESWWFLAAQVAFILALLFTSHLVDRTGGFFRLSDFLVLFAVVIIFQYIKTIYNPVIGRYSDGIIFFKILMTALMVMLLNPAKEFVKKTLKKMVKSKPD
jgi:hypothetical protein